MLPPLEAPVDNLLPMFQTEKPLTESQIRYAAFPANLKAALKAAGERNGWTPADYELQTQLIHDTTTASVSVQDGRAWHPATLDQLVSAYTNPPPERPA